MRPVTVLLLSCLLQLSAGVDAQTTFEIHVRDVPFQHVLDIGVEALLQRFDGLGARRGEAGA